MRMYVEDNLNCPMSRFIVRSCPRWMWMASLIHLVNLLMSLKRILLVFHSMVCATWSLIVDFFFDSRLRLLLLWPTASQRHSDEACSKQRAIAHKVNYISDFELMKISSNWKLPIRWTSSTNVGFLGGDVTNAKKIDWVKFDIQYVE